MTSEESKQFNRDQLAKVLLELAHRAKETDEQALASILYALVGSMVEGSEVVLATLIGEYIKIRLGLPSVIDENEPEDDPEN